MKNGAWEGDALKRPGRQMRSVWSIPAPKPGEKRFGRHPTQKPLDLLVRIILASSGEGDLVLDPFTGSSTTGLACMRTGRRFIGVDSERKYLDLSVKRHGALMRESGPREEAG
jgi:site-specific DNA-methyltransferase (adenine-specific)